MFVDFFYKLKSVGIPVSPTSFLTLHKALGGGLVNSLEDFYTASRAILIKSERYFDLYDQVFAHSFQGADMPDPDNFLFPLFASDSPANFTGFRNDQIDQMLIEARGIVDPVRRAEMYQQIEKQILQTCPIIPLFYLSIDRVYQPEVQNIKISALGADTMPLHRIWLKGKSHR